MISLDTETTGVDLYHGAEPYFVTICHDDDRQQFWEWDVDPLTRKVLVPEGDAEEIREVIESADAIATQNGKFDWTALFNAKIIQRIPWEKNHDTLIGGHMLASNHKHGLDAMAVEYLGIDIAPYEERMHEACNAARRLARSKYPNYRLAKEGLPDMPSVKQSKQDKKDRGVESESPWKADAWLLKHLAQLLNYPKPVSSCDHLWSPDNFCHLCKGHYWHVGLRIYANWDSAVTLPLWNVMERRIKEEGLWKVYLERRKLPRLGYLLENYGASLNMQKTRETRTRLQEGVAEATAACLKVAESFTVNQCRSCNKLVGEAEWSFEKRCECKKPKHVVGPYDLKMPNGNVNDSLRAFCFSVLRLPHVANPKATTDMPTLDTKNAMPFYRATLLPDTPQHEFISAFGERNDLVTAISYLEAYERYWIPCGVFNEKGEQLWARIRSSLNPTGTDHLRWSSSNPNNQNISKSETECKACDGEGCKRCHYTGISKASLREVFGPMPGREWYSFDAKNIERRIPAFEANEEAIIELLEQPDKPPYYGSEHSLVGHIIFPKEFESCRDANGNLDGRIFKKRYKATCYQRTKNFNFALQYQCGEATGDRTSQVPGSFRLVKARFAKQEALNQYWVNFANKHGYVETIPDKEVDPDHGYRILCTRNSWGKVSPTIPLNYHSSGTAMQWTNRAMVKVQDVLDDWNRKLPTPQYFMTLQVHDELVLDFPKRADPRKNPRGSNLWRAREIQRVMESCGPAINVPTPVGLEFHPDNWEVGVTF